MKYHLNTAVISGAVGALFLNGLHETARKNLKSAPHVDLIGMRVLGRSFRKMGLPMGQDFPLSRLRKITLAGDLLSNALYYTAAVSGNSRPWKKAALWGLAAGVGGVLIPLALDLGEETSRKNPYTSLMTVAWYLSGALVAAGVSEALKLSEAGCSWPG